jgi:transposase
MKEGFMPERDIITMSMREVKRLKAVQEAIAGQITQRHVAEFLRLSERQVRRLIKAVRTEGEKGIVHKARGKPSNRQITSDTKGRAIAAYKGTYLGFGPTLAIEKLQEREGIWISKETLRKWLLEEGLWSRIRKGSTHRRRRERKECFGEMVQMDGSHHDWLEGRGPKVVLMGYIDDATGNVFGRFYDYEGTVPAMESFKRYAIKHGLPQSVYLDKHSTYKSTSQSKEEELEEKPLSQFERALKELGVTVIHANSPQAKGRVERLFGVLQDRLVKEMRLRGIASKDEANDFLQHYLPGFNKRFRVPASKSADLHVPLRKGLNLDDYLCIKTNRVLRNDNTVSLNGRLFQIEEPVGSTHLEMQERLNGRLVIKAEGRSLKYTTIKPPPKPVKKPAESKARRAAVSPNPTHPWKRWQPSKPKNNRWAYAY